MKRIFDYQTLESMPTIHQGQFDNLKYDNGTYRIWLSRATMEDRGKDERGVYLPHDSVTVEKYINGCWETVQGSGNYVEIDDSLT